MNSVKNSKNTHVNKVQKEWVSLPFEVLPLSKTEQVVIRGCVPDFISSTDYL